MRSLVMQKSKLSLCLLMAVAGLTSSFDAAEAQESSCFMVTPSGNYMDLSNLCKKSPPPQKPKPVYPSAKARTAKRSPSYPALSYPSEINLLAFLRVIRYAEGTDSSDGYNIQFTGVRFGSFADHPRRVVCSYYSGRQLCSSAAGAYQFLETTWDDVASSIGAGDFRPEWQDRAAIELIRRAGALDDVLSGRIEEAIGKVAPVWASFPRWYGDYYGEYGQSVVSMDELVQEFRRQQQIVASSLPRGSKVSFNRGTGQ
jgi:muramidase (phage lysozyme)